MPISQTPKEIIAGLYAAVFNRAPDKEGLDFWAAQAGAGDATEIYQDIMDPAGSATGFVDHPVFKADYDSLTNAEFAAKIYENALGQAGDQEGINFWTKELDLGMSRGDMVVEFVQGALTGDFTAENFPNLTPEELTAARERQDYLQNKVNVAIHWIDELGDKTNVTDANNPESDPAYIASISVLKEVNQDPDTVDHMNAIIDAASPTADSPQFIIDHVAGHDQSVKEEGIIQTATTIADTFEGATGDDQFIATQDTLGLGDTFDGKEGNDKLSISISGTNAVTLTGFGTENVETIEVKSLSTEASILDMSDVIDAKDIISRETDGATFAFRDIQDTNATINIIDTVQDHLVDYDLQSLQGANDTVKLAIQEIRPETGTAVVDIAFTQDTNTDAAIENLEISSNNITNNVNSISVGDALTGMKIDGNASLTIVTALDKNIATLDAGAHTGAALNLDMRDSATAVTYTGSQGIDTVTFKGTANNNTISLGAGNDHLTVGSGNDTVSGDAGNDTFHFDGNELSISDTVSGGAGNDRIIIEQQDEIQRTETQNVSGVETIELQDAGSLLVVTDNLISGGAEGLEGDAKFTIDTTAQTGDHTIDMTEVTDTSGFVYTGGTANDTLLISDGQLNSTASLTFGDGLADTMKVVNGATITADDFNNISGLEVIVLISDSTQPQTWSLEGIPAGLTIIADATIPQGSVLNLSDSEAASVTFANNANISVNDPTGIAVVRSLLEFTENADDLVGTGADDVFHASTLDQIQGADAADGLTHISGDELILDFAVVNAANGTSLQLGNPGINNIEIVTFNTQNSVRLTDDNTFGTYNMGTGDDVFNASVLGGNAVVNMNAGNDTFNDNSTPADFTISGQAGSDTFNIDSAVLDANDTLDGGADADTMNLNATVVLANDIKFTNVSNIETLNVAGNLAGGAEFQNAAFTKIMGSAGDDGLTFTSETALTIDATTFASTDADFGANGGVTNVMSLDIDAGAGDDSIAGGSGDDIIVDGTGSDLIIGAAGADTINLAADNNNDVIAYTRAGDGGNTNAPVDGFDIIKGFNNDNTVGDSITIEGSLLAAITGSSTTAMTTLANNDASLDVGITDLAVYTNTSLSNPALTDLSNGGDLLTFLNNSLDTAGAGDAAIFSVQGTSDSGVYFYQENGGDNIIDQSEIRMLSSVEGSLLEANDFTSALLQPPQTLTAVAASVDEGANAVFNLATAGVADGTILNYTVTGVNAADITDANADGDNNPLTGTVTVNNDTGTITIPVAADATTEVAPETMSVSVDVNGTAVSADILINDTSTTPLGPVATSLDALNGTVQAAVTTDADTGSFNYTDDTAVTSNVIINNFGADDEITISGATLNDYNSVIATQGNDVVISYNDGGTVSQITVVGVIGANDVVFNVATFNDLSVGDMSFA